MKYNIFCFCLLFIFASCKKEKTITEQKGCNLTQVYIDNAKKVSITKGVWGTVSNLEGNCMPVTQPTISTCSNCPVQRTVKIYQYTLFSDAVASDPYSLFFDSFSTTLVAQTETDEKGFFQIEIPAGHYTIVIVEEGKLYTVSRDGQGGLSPFTFSAGVTNVNLTMTYKAAF